jgi:hypothetical protein
MSAVENSTLAFEDAGRLLDPAPLRLEMGIERLRSGALHVAARTDLHGCSGEMFDWWFRWFHTTQHYVWWHPVDHVSSAWVGWQPGRYVGATNVVEERLSGPEVHKLHIHFRDPRELLGREAVDRAFANGAVSAIVIGNVGPGAEPPRDAEGRPIGGRLAHVARDTSFGCTLRSHFWLGHDLAGLATPEQIAAIASDELGFGLLRHAYNEFTFLSRILPALHAAENRDRTRPELPWELPTRG